MHSQYWDLEAQQTLWVLKSSRVMQRFDAHDCLYAAVCKWRSQLWMPQRNLNHELYVPTSIAYFHESKAFSARYCSPWPPQFSLAAVENQESGPLMHTSYPSTQTTSLYLRITSLLHSLTMEIIVVSKISTIYIHKKLHVWSNRW